MTFATKNDFICYTAALLIAAGIGHTAESASVAAKELADQMDTDGYNTWS